MSSKGVYPLKVCTVNLILNSIFGCKSHSDQRGKWNCHQLHKCNPQSFPHNLVCLGLVDVTVPLQQNMGTSHSSISLSFQWKNDWGYFTWSQQHMHVIPSHVMHVQSQANSGFCSNYQIPFLFLHIHKKITFLCGSDLDQQLHPIHKGRNLPSGLCVGNATMENSHVFKSWVLFAVTV